VKDLTIYKRSNIDEYFDTLANYANRNFFSDDTISLYSANFNLSQSTGQVYPEPEVMY